MQPALSRKSVFHFETSVVYVRFIVETKIELTYYTLIKVCFFFVMSFIIPASDSNTCDCGSEKGERKFSVEGKGTERKVSNPGN